MKLALLKLIHGGLLTGMPSLVYNPLTRTPLNIPLTIAPNSVYLNFKLSPDSCEHLTEYINSYTDKLSITPISMYPNEKKSKYLSVNIYNCTSPAFLNCEKWTTRCEINTYVKDKETGTYGTLILDYLSNDLSMDPVNLFKEKNDISFINSDTGNIKINCSSLNENIELFLTSNINNSSRIAISNELISYSDYIYYKNGIYDKLYYDSTLVEAPLKTPDINSWANMKFKFCYKDLIFDRIDSIFYFENRIKFVGSMWENL